MNNLGEYLKALRESKGLTLREVEKLSDVSNAYLSQLESEKIKRPSPTMLHKLAQVYEVKYELLMEKAGYPPTSTFGTTSKTAQQMRHRLGNISKEEEVELLEYLKFMRSRKK